MLLCVFLVSCSLISPSYAYSNLNKIELRAFGTETQQLVVYLNVPSFSSSLYNYTVQNWKCPITINYQLTYNLNTGEITSVNFLGSEIVPGTAMTADERAHLLDLNYESANLRITNSGHSVTCNYSAQAHLVYYEFPSVLQHPEHVTTYLTAAPVTHTPPLE